MKTARVIPVVALAMAQLAYVAAASPECGGRCPIRVVAHPNSFLDGSVASEPADLLVTFGHYRENNRGHATAIATTASSGKRLWTFVSDAIGDDNFVDATIDHRRARVFLTGYRAPTIARFPVSDFFQLTVALDMRTGRELWTHTTTVPGYADMGYWVYAALDGGSVYVVGHHSRQLAAQVIATNSMETDLRVTKFDARTGEVLWTYHYVGPWRKHQPQGAALSPDGSRLLVVGYVYESQNNDRYDLMLDTASGEPLWINWSKDKSTSDSSRRASFNARGDIVFVAHEWGHRKDFPRGFRRRMVSITAYKAATGKRLWNRTLGLAGAHLYVHDIATVAGGPCVAGMTKDPYEHEPDRLIRNGFAACYRADGSLRWRWIGRPSERPAEREAITGDRTDVVVTGSRVTALGRRAILTEVRDTATGRIRWRGTYDGVDGNWVSTGGRDAFLWSRKVVIAGHVVLGLQTQKVQLIYAR